MHLSPYPTCPGLTHLQRLQIETARLKADISTLKTITSVNQGHVVTSASSALSDTTTPDQDKRLRIEYRGLGRRFAILAELWVQRSHLGRPCTINIQSSGPWDLGRCANNTAWDEGIVAELYFFLPSRYHEFIENSELFSAEVCQNPSEYPLTSILHFPL